MARKMRRLTDVDEVDDWYETMLRSGPLPGDDAAEALCNAVLHRINEYRAGNGGDEIDAEIMLPELRTAIIIMVHGGRDPHKVPYRHVRHALDNPVSLRVREFRGEWVVEEAINDYPVKLREAIDGPLRSIRTWCIGCQGGDMNGVRACPSVNCFLWSFRMQSNPFYGRLKAGDNDDEEDGFEGDAVMAEADEAFEAEERQRFAELGNK